MLLDLCSVTPGNGPLCGPPYMPLPTPTSIWLFMPQGFGRNAVCVSSCTKENLRICSSVLYLKDRWNVLDTVDKPLWSALRFEIMTMLSSSVCYSIIMINIYKIKNLRPLPPSRALFGLGEVHIISLKRCEFWGDGGLYFFKTWIWGWAIMGGHNKNTEKLL